MANQPAAARWLHIERRNGHLTLSGYRANLRPQMSVAEFVNSDLGRAAHLIDNRVRKWGFSRFELPPVKPKGAVLWTQAWFDRNMLESLWLRPSPVGTPPETRCGGERSLPQRLGWQAELLRQQIGCPAGQYRWGLVWNRYNPHYGFFDVSVAFAFPDRLR